MATKTLKVWPVGTEIHLGAALPGMITAIRIQGDNFVDYECAYWNSGKRETVWCALPEFTVGPKQSRDAIGFRNGDQRA